MSSINRQQFNQFVSVMGDAAQGSISQYLIELSVFIDTFDNLTAQQQVFTSHQLKSGAYYFGAQELHIILADIEVLIQNSIDKTTHITQQLDRLITQLRQIFIQNKQDLEQLLTEITAKPN